MTDSEEPRPPREGGGEAPSGLEPEPPRTISLAAVAGVVVLVGLIGFALYRRSHPPATPRTAPAAAPSAGTPITAVVPVRLTPEASIIAERYRCVCGCRDLLNVCTCSKTPGSNDMKKFLQEQVNQKKTADQIDAAMVARYGSEVLLGAAPSPSPTPVRRPARRKR